MLHNLATDPLDGLIHRSTGPLRLRFLLQPLIVTFLVVRSGLKGGAAFARCQQAKSAEETNLRSIYAQEVDL